MFVTIDELDPAGVIIKTVIQTDYISSLKETSMDFSYMCQVCHINGNGVARHDRDWCIEHDFLDEYHERKPGESDVPVTIISMMNGDTMVAKGQLQLSLV